jgi:glycerol-3-phosphate dehydrogenase
MGGKYTTYRAMAEEALKLVTKKELKDTREFYPLFGGGVMENDAGLNAKEFNVDVDIVNYLKGIYGAQFKSLLNLIKEDASLKQPICKGTKNIKAQVVYALKEEMAVTKSDIMERRLGLVYEDCSRSECENAVEQLMEKYKD